MTETQKPNYPVCNSVGMSHCSDPIHCGQAVYTNEIFEPAGAQTDPDIQARISRHCMSVNAELEAYRAAVRVDVQMSGPKFKGCDLSQLRRAWEITQRTKV